MKRYGFEAPPGWVRRPFPPPQRGVYLTAPPGTPRAAILLMEPIAPHGDVLAQLETVVDKGCAGTRVVERVAARPIGRAAAGAGLDGAFAVTRVVMTFESRARDEARCFALLEGLLERLPIVYLSDASALPTHRGALEQVLTSIQVLVPAGESLY
jgi:hypothetical protein